MEILIGGLCCVGFLVLLVGGGVGYYFYASKQIKKQEEKIVKEGKRVLCYVARADDSIYERSEASGYSEVRVVFSTEKRDNLEEMLEDAGRRLVDGDIVDPDAEVPEGEIERFYDEYKNNKWPKPPIRLPKWLIGDFKCYTASLQVYWSKLRKKKLTKPYLYAYVILGENGGLVMEDEKGRDEAE